MTWHWQYIVDIIPALLGGLWITVLATVSGMALALIGGLILALMRRSSSRVIRHLSYWCMEFFRNTPLLIQLYFLFFVLPRWGIVLSPLVTGIIGLGLHYSAYTTEVYRAGIDSVPLGQWDAARALGFGPKRTFLTLILPQALPPIVPALGNYLVSMFKDTPLLSAITVMEMLGVAKDLGSISFRYVEVFTLVGVLFLLVSLGAAWVVSRAEIHLQEKFKI